MNHCILSLRFVEGKKYQRPLSTQIPIIFEGTLCFLVHFDPQHCLLGN